MEIEANEAPKDRKCVRRTMLIISGLMMLVGFAIFVFGVYLYVAGSEILAGTTLLGILLALGFIIFIIAAMGFCGAFKRSPCWLCLYSTVLFLLIAAQIALVVVVLLDQVDIDKFLDDRWGDLDNESKNSFQDNFDCCGYPGFKEDPGDECPAMEDMCTDPLDESTCDGCKKALEDQLKDRLLEIQIAGGVALFVELAMLIMSYCLLATERKQERYRKHTGADQYGYGY